MSTAMTILIILLGVGFVILLGLTIALILIVMSILKSLKHIALKAERTTDSFSDIAMMVGKRAAPVALSAAIAGALRRLKK